MACARWEVKVAAVVYFVSSWSGIRHQHRKEALLYGRGEDFSWQWVPDRGARREVERSSLWVVTDNLTGSGVRHASLGPCSSELRLCGLLCDNRGLLHVVTYCCCYRGAVIMPRKQVGTEEEEGKNKTKEWSKERKGIGEIDLSRLKVCQRPKHAAHRTKRHCSMHSTIPQLATEYQLVKNYACSTGTQRKRHYWNRLDQFWHCHHPFTWKKIFFSPVR
ncbi:hypothetical protein EJB05_01984, partial [Eragrostis curvula]